MSGFTASVRIRTTFFTHNWIIFVHLFETFLLIITTIDEILNKQIELHEALGVEAPTSSC